MVKPKAAPEEENHPLIQSFLDQKDAPDFPVTLALNALEKLESSSSDEEELSLFLLEDIVFSSIYATFYEAIFAAIKNNPQLADRLVEQFEKSTQEREQVIAQQSEHHVHFILNSGHCEGCPSCQHHDDVNELLPHWQRGNRDFFLTLYLGMQSIQCAMEQLLYETVPDNPKLIPLLGQQDILRFRQFIYRYASQHY